MTKRSQLPSQISWCKTGYSEIPQTMLWFGWLLLFLFSISSIQAGQLTISPISAYNLVVDSNVTTPATYGPKSAILGAEICNEGSSDLTDLSVYIGDYDPDGNSLTADHTPGVYPPTDSDDTTPGSDTDGDGYTKPAEWTSDFLNNTGEYAFTHEGGSAGTGDASRWIGDLDAGNCQVAYWLVSYPQCANVGGQTQNPPCDTSVAGGGDLGGASSKPFDDLFIDYDIWAEADNDNNGSLNVTADTTRRMTMRNELSASANKIWPNTDSKVPDEYIDSISQAAPVACLQSGINTTLGWDTVTPTGDQVTSDTKVYPGEWVVTTEGVWYDMGRVGEGFDNNGDFFGDYNAWLQPIGDPSAWDAGCFRLVNTCGVVIVKLNDGSEKVITFEDQMYFENLPQNNTGAVGLVFYQFVGTGAGCAGAMTPYQEVASGSDNEKFSADFGASMGFQTSPFDPDKPFGFEKSATVVDNDVTYLLEGTNDTGVNLGATDYGVPLMFIETTPTGTTYVDGTADNDLEVHWADNDAVVAVNDVGYAISSYDGVTEYCYKVTEAPNWKILYSEDNGNTWLTKDPRSGNVTDIKWLLFTEIAIDNTAPTTSGDRATCPDAGVSTNYQDGTEYRSLGNGQKMSIQFTVDASGTALVCNTADISLGGSGALVDDSYCTLTQGTNRIKGAVFEDDGDGTATLADGTQNTNDEIDIGNITVSLYYDGNGDGLTDNDEVDFLVETYSTKSDAADPTNTTTPLNDNDDFLFDELPAGTYVVVVDSEDADLPEGYANSTEDSVSITITGTDTSSFAYFGFAPALQLTKTLATTGTVYTGDLVQFDIDVENVLTTGDSGSGFCTYEVWAGAHTGDTADGGDNSDNPSTNLGDWTNQNNVLGETDSVNAQLIFDSNNAELGLTSFDLSDVDGAEIVSVGYRIVMAETVDMNAGDEFTINLYHGTGGGDTTQVESDQYLGNTAPFSGTASQSFDLEATFDYEPTGGWSLTDFANKNTELQIYSKKSGNSAGTLTIDAIALVVTTNGWCGGGETILNPVPLRDQFNNTELEFVTADPAISSETALGNNTLLEWDNVGPVYPGQTNTVSVTFRALTETGSPHTNFVIVDEAKYANGRDANADNDTADVPVSANSATKTITGIVWNDNNTQGTYESGTESPHEGVLVQLYGCQCNTSPNCSVVNTDDVAYGELIAVNGAKNSIGSCTDEGGIWVLKDFTYTDAGTTTNFSFTGLRNGYYRVVVDDTTVPDGSQAAAQTAQPTDASGNTTSCTDPCTPEDESFAEDSDMVTANNNPEEEIDLVTQSSITLGFGYNSGTISTNLTITGNLFYDWNGDAVDAGATEEGIAGVAVYLYDSKGDYVATAVTDLNGNYSFTGLTSGAYDIRIDTEDSDFPANYSPTLDPDESGVLCSTCDSVANNVAAGTTGVDFGYEPLGDNAISSVVWEDTDGDGVQDSTEEGIADITVTLQVDLNGDGTYVNLSTTTTDADGNYSFTDLPDGDYRVIVDDTDTDLPTDGMGDAYTPTNATQYDLTFGDSDTGGISGSVLADQDSSNGFSAGDTGISGVKIELYDSTGTNLLATTYTDANGDYSFTGLPADDYVVKETDAGATGPSDAGTSVTDSDGGSADTEAANTISSITVTADEINTGNDFLDDPTSGLDLSSISGTVYADDNDNDSIDAGDTGIAGITVKLYVDADGNGSPDSTTPVGVTTTDSSGDYQFTDYPDGQYVVIHTVPNDATSVTDADGNTNGTNAVVADTSGGTDSTGNDFLDEDVSLNGIYGRVYLDSDGDGDTTDSDSGLTSSATITLYSDPNGDGDPSDGVVIATTTSSASTGYYSFDNLPDGNYVVVESDPSGYVSTIDADGSTDNNWNQVAVTLSGSDSSGNDFWDAADDNTNLGSISGAVYDDDNNDLAFGSDLAISGVTVSLYADTDGNGTPDGEPIATDTTAGTGAYSFVDLPAGDYVIVETDNDGYTSVTDDEDDRTSPDYNRIAVTLTTGGTSSGNDFLDSDELSNIGGTVYEDDGDTALETGGDDTGIPGVTIGLYIDSDQDGLPDDTTAVATTSTDANGDYLFSNVPYGKYVVIEFDPDGVTSITDADAPSAGDSGGADGANAVTVDTSGGGNDTDNDFLDDGASLNTISGAVINDANANGVDDGESGLSGVTVALYSDPNGDGDPSDGELITTDTTDVSGNYSFTSIPNGSYVIVETDSDGYISTMDLDNDNNNSWNQIAVTIDDANSTGNDFLDATGTASISGTVYKDDGDGEIETSDTAISAVTVTLYADSNGDGIADGEPLATTITDSSGDYSFTELPAGDYVVVETDPTNYYSSADADTDKNGKDPDNTANDSDNSANQIAVTLTTGETSLDNDFLDDTKPNFGFNGLGAIGDTIFLDINGNGEQDGSESGITGVTVNLYKVLWNGDTDDSDGDGNVVDNDELDFAGKTLLTSETTDNDGNYLFEGLEALSGNYYYLVEVTASGDLADLSTQTADPDFGGIPCDPSTDAWCDSQLVVYNFSAGSIFRGADFGYQSDVVAINGTVWNDTDGDTKYWDDVDADGTRSYTDIDGDGILDYEPLLESGLAGVTVTLYLTDDTFVAETTTDADGGYSFTEDNDGNALVSGTSYKVVVTSSDVSAYGAYCDADDGSNSCNTAGIASAHTVTDPLASLTGIATHVDFGYQYSLAGSYTLSGSLCLEDTTDGFCGTVQDSDDALASGETGYENIEVRLIRKSDGAQLAAVKTNSSGLYSFSNVPDDDYIIRIGAPASYLSLTTEAADTPASTVVGSTDSDGYFSSGYQEVTVSGSSIEGLDFAFEIADMDFGDLPTKTQLPSLSSDYATQSGVTGARHLLPVGGATIYLGSTAPGTGANAETEGQPGLDADQDIGNGANEEDSVVLQNQGTWREGSSGELKVAVSGSGSGCSAAGCWLVGYMDLNKDGDFADANELIISAAVASGDNDLYSFSIPSTSELRGDLYGRFRVFTSEPAVAAIAYKGITDDGEVEDFKWSFNWDYGDAPDSYDTSYTPDNDSARQGDGMRHFVPTTPLLYMGSGVGSEDDGDPVTDGVDPKTSPVDDSDDYSVDSFEIVYDRYKNETNAVVRVKVVNNSGSSAQLVGWLDLNGDSDFADSSVGATDDPGAASPDDDSYERSSPALARIDDNDEDICVLADNDDAMSGGDCDYAGWAFDDSVDNTFTTGNIPDGFEGYVWLQWNAIDKTQITGDPLAYIRLRLTTESGFFSDSSPEAAGAAADGEGTDGGVNPEVTYAVISGMRAYLLDGLPVVEWTTSGESGTIGFDLYRQAVPGDEHSGYIKLNDELLPGLLNSSVGGSYFLIDEGISPAELHRYKLIEYEVRQGGIVKQRHHGPYTIYVEPQAPDDVEVDPDTLVSEGYANHGQAVSAEKQARNEAAKEAKKAAKANKKAKKSSDVAKLFVKEPGLYQVTAEQIAEWLHIDLSEAEKQIRKYGYALTSQGRDVPYHAAEDEQSLYFYNPGYESIYTDTNVFWLALGKTGIEMEVIQGSPVVKQNSGKSKDKDQPDWPAPTGTETFMTTVKVEENHYPLLSFGLHQADEDYWAWDFLFAGYGTTCPSWGTKCFDFVATSVDMSVQAELQLEIFGATDSAANPDHHLVAWLNDQQIGDVTWDGVSRLTVDFTVDPGVLIDGANTLKLQGLKAPGVPYSIFYVDRFTLSYSSHYQAADDALTFSTEEHPAIQLEGFSEATIQLVDVTDPWQPIWVELTVEELAAGDYGAILLPTAVERIYQAATENAAFTVNDAWTDIPSDLTTANLSSEYVVIATEEVWDAAVNLADLRANQGLTTIVVDLEDILDEFNDGLSSPWAIRDFLAHAYQQWDYPPHYVVLAGAGSYDYQNYTGASDSLIPSVMIETPYGLAATDQRFVDVVGDDSIPEMMLGRIPVLTNEELQAYLDKLIIYENAGASVWKEHVLLAADNPDQAGDFRADSEDIADLVPIDYQLDEVYLGAPHPGDGFCLTGSVTALSATAAHCLTNAALNDGVGYFNYVGHGSQSLLADERIFVLNDVAALTNTDRHFIGTFMTCAASNYALPAYDALGEALVLKQGGGAIAVWGPTGLSINNEAKEFSNTFYSEVFKQEAKTLGEAILEAHQKYGAHRYRFMHDIYNLLGDPALQLH